MSENSFHDNQKKSAHTVAEMRNAGGHTHSLWAVDRKEFTVKGVTNVVSFDDRTVDLNTVCGRMTVEGRNLHITVLDTAGGTVALTGLLCGIAYETSEEQDDNSDKKHRFARLFH